MASSSAPVHPARYLSVFVFMLVGVYLLVFLTGDKKAAPKLGIDLQGGTRVTLTARTPDGSRPSREALAQAQQIISARVNGLGVSGSEVVVDGDNLIITVPGTNGNEARNLGQTARLYIRPVTQAVPVQPQEAPKPKPPHAAARPASRRPAPARPVQPAPGQPAAGAPARADRRPATSAGTRAPQPRPYPQDPPPTPSPTPAPAPAPPRHRLPALRRRRGPRRRTPPPGEPPAPPDPRKDLADRIQERRNCGRAPTRTFSCLPCSTRPPAAAMTTSWPATTTRSCRW